MSTDVEPVAPRRSALKLAFMFLPLALFLALALLFLIRLYGDDPATLPSALIGRTVPEFRLPPVEGLEQADTPVPGLASGDLEGEVSVVNVWASWCVPCRDENPVLMDLAARGVPVHGINYKDAPENARGFLNQFGNPFSRVGADASGRTAIDWGVYGVPETFVVDAQGRIVFKHVGPLTAAQMNDILLPQVEAAREAR
jgi:cytochrome c biogenesis protein CcmG/thiol:disulfide interchange protein DsbE